MGPEVTGIETGCRRKRGPDIPASGRHPARIRPEWPVANSAPPPATNSAIRTARSLSNRMSSGNTSRRYLDMSASPSITSNGICILQHHPRGSCVAFRCPMTEMGRQSTGLGFDRKQRDICLIFRRAGIGLQLPYPLVGRTDQVISCRGSMAPRGCQLVADRTMRTHGNHLAALEDQRIRAFEAAELAPVGMESPGHTQHRQAQAVRIARQSRESDRTPSRPSAGFSSSSWP